MDRKGIHPAAIAAILIVLLGAAVTGVYFWRRAPPPPAELTAPPPEATRAESPPPPPQELLPVLDESDTLVRRVVAELSSHPRLLTWMAADEDLVRAFVAAVDRVAAGESPRTQLAAWAPEGAFAATARDDGTLVEAPESKARYDLVVDVLTAVDTESAALAFQRLRPLFAEAYREIGPPDTTFDDVVAVAIAELLSVPAVTSPALEATVEGYRYRNPALENLSPAQKHLMRTGGSNIRRIQEKLRAFAAAVSLPAE